MYYEEITLDHLDRGRVGEDNVLLVSHGGVMNIILCLENAVPYTNKETHFQIKDAEIVQINM